MEFASLFLFRRPTFFDDEPDTYLGVKHEHVYDCGHPFTYLDEAAKFTDSPEVLAGLEEVRYRLRRGEMNRAMIEGENVRDVAYQIQVACGESLDKKHALIRSISNARLAIVSLRAFYSFDEVVDVAKKHLAVRFDVGRVIDKVLVIAKRDPKQGLAALEAQLSKPEMDVELDDAHYRLMMTRLGNILKAHIAANKL